jgi:hypothetical protein
MNAIRFIPLVLCLIGSRGYAQDTVIADVAGTAVGVYSSIYVHELGHALALKAMGAENIVIEVPPTGQVFGGITTADLPETPLTRSQAQLISVAGFAAANVASEFMLQSPNLYGSQAARGFMGANLVSNVRHVYSYYTQVRGRNGYKGNDIDNYELAGGNPHWLSAALIGYTVWSLQRMQKNEIPLFFISLKM